MDFNQSLFTNLFHIFTIVYYYRVLATEILNLIIPDYQNQKTCILQYVNEIIDQYCYF